MTLFQRILSRALAPLRFLGRVQQTATNLARYQHLTLLSDKELAARGLRREDVARIILPTQSAAAPIRSRKAEAMPEGVGSTAAPAASSADRLAA